MHGKTNKLNILIFNICDVNWEGKIGYHIESGIYIYIFAFVFIIYFFKVS